MPYVTLIVHHLDFALEAEEIRIDGESVERAVRDFSAVEQDGVRIADFVAGKAPDAFEGVLKHWEAP